MLRPATPAYGLLSQASRKAGDALDEAEHCIQRIREEILGYLARFPRAGDTLPGVARWWLQATADAPPELVQAALDRLVTAGHMTRTQGPDGNLHYAAALPRPAP